MIKLMAMAPTCISTELSLSAFGTKTCNMDMDTRLCSTATILKAIIDTEKRMVSAHLNGTMARYMSASSKIMTSMGLVLTDGATVVAMKVTGATT